MILTMFLYILAYFFAVSLLKNKTNFKYQFFYFQVYGVMLEENRMYQQLTKICREKVCRIKVIRASLDKFGQKSFEPPKNYLLLHLCLNVMF